MLPPYVVLGPACEDATYFTAAITSRYSKDIHISYAASTPLLSDVENFPLFYRTVPSYTAYNRAIYGIMQEFHWSNIAVVHEEEPHYTLTVEDLAVVLNQNNINGSDSNAQIIKTLGQAVFIGQSSSVVSRARIFVAMVPENQAVAVMCNAFKLGMTGENFQWILIGDYHMDWWMQANRTFGIQRDQNIHCTLEDLKQAVESALILTHHQQVLSPKMKATLSARQLAFFERFELAVSDKSNARFQSKLSTGVITTYDAVWSVAHALKRVLESNGDGRKQSSESINRGLADSDLFNVANGNTNARGRPISQATATLNAAMEMTDFEGVAGRIYFNSMSHSQQKPVTYIMQMQSGIMIPIGKHVGSNDSTDLNFYGNKLTWQGTSFPRDRPTRNMRRVALWVVVVMLVISALGLIFSIIILVVNWTYRKHKVIKASSLYLNFAIVSGCISGFVSIFFLSVESLDINFHIPLSVYPFLCNFRPWLLSLAFNLAFGALFAKTFRIYLVFKNPWVRRRPFKDNLLFAMLGILIAYDVVVLVIWAAIGPLSLIQRVVNYKPVEFTEEAYLYCVSSSADGVVSYFLIWIALIAVPKTFLLVFGVFLVVHTSKIKAIFFRDAKFTGIAIFGFVVACGFGVPTAFFTMFFFLHNITYIASTATILTCCYLVLAMVFIPKFVLLKKYRKKIPSRVLLGLNPSFRVQRNTTRMARAQTVKNKKQFPPHLTRGSKTVYSSPNIVDPLSKSCPIQRSSIITRHSHHLDAPCHAVEVAVLKPEEEQREYVGTLEDWWEPAFAAESSHVDVQEANVSFDGYEGIIYVVNTTNCDSGSDTTINMTAEGEQGREEFGVIQSPESFVSNITEEEYFDHSESRILPYFHYSSYSEDCSTPSIVITRSMTLPLPNQYH